MTIFFSILTFSVCQISDSRIRITRNPLPLNYMEAPDSIQQASTFDDISRINRDARFSVAGPSYR